MSAESDLRALLALAETERCARFADLPHPLPRQADSLRDNVNRHTSEQRLNDGLVTILKYAGDPACLVLKVVHEHLLSRLIHVKRILPHVSSWAGRETTS